MKWFIDRYIEDKRTRVLDVGSYDVNGTYKDLLEDIVEYTGLDIASGPNVDIVPRDIYNWAEIENASYDVVLCGQVFEHSEFFWLTMREIVKALKKGGVACIIAPADIREHRYPVDCWRFYTDGMVALSKYYCLDLLHASTERVPSSDSKYENWTDKRKSDSMLIVRKPYHEPYKTIETADYILVPAIHDQICDSFIKYEQPISRKPGRRLLASLMKATKRFN